MMARNIRNGSLPCALATDGVEQTVNCVMSMYPSASSLSREMYEEILAQNFGHQKENGQFMYWRLVKQCDAGLCDMTTQESYDRYAANGYALSNADGENHPMLPLLSWNPEDVPSHIGKHIQGYFIEELGCTDPYAENFSQSANTDDGSCYYVGEAGAEEGCKNQNALNFNPDPNVSACEDCCVMDYVGCTNATALNYDPVATEPCTNCCDFGSSDEESIMYDTPSEASDLFSTENIAFAAGGIVVIGLLIYGLRK